MEFENTKKAAIEFSLKVIERAQLNLGTYGFAWLKANRRIDASNKLKNSLFAKTLMQGTGILIEYFSFEMYANYVEDGTRPSQKNPSKTMVDSIKEWMKVKPVRLRQRRPNALSKASSVFSPMGVKAREQAAWAIATSRLRRGSKSLPFMQEAVESESVNDDSLDIIGRGMAKDIELAIFTAVKKNSNSAIVKISIT